MPKIKILRSVRCGSKNARVDEVIDVSEKDADTLITYGDAELVVDGSPVEPDPEPVKEKPAEKPKPKPKPAAKKPRRASKRAPKKEG